MCLCILLAAAAGATALDLLDPSSLVGALSSAGAGVERWHRPDFWWVQLRSAVSALAQAAQEALSGAFLQTVEQHLRGAKASSSPTPAQLPPAFLLLF